MSPSADVRRLEFDVDFQPGHAAAYLVPGDEPVLFDAGTLGSDGRRDLHEDLADHAFEAADVAHVVLTHFHNDHVGTVDELVEAGDPTLHVPTTFRDRLDPDLDAVRETAGETLRRAGVPADEREAAIDGFVRGQEIMSDIVFPERVGHWIEPGEPTTVGGLDVEPIHTPGHCATHVCYRTTLGDEVALFSGDMAIEPFRSIVVNGGLGDGVAEGVEAYHTALDRLASTTADRVYPGHGPVHDDLAGTVERDRSTLERRVASCEGAIREPGSHALHVAERLTEDGSGVGILTEVIGALEYLEREGRARSWVDDDVRYYAPA